MTSSNGNIFRVTGPLCGEFTDDITNASDAELWCFLWLNKRWSKQSRHWWFETPSRSLWRPCDELLLANRRSVQCNGWVNKTWSLKHIYAHTWIWFMLEARPFVCVKSQEVRCHQTRFCHRREKNIKYCKNSWESMIRCPSTRLILL